MLCFSLPLSFHIFHYQTDLHIQRYVLLIYILHHFFVWFVTFVIICLVRDFNNKNTIIN